MSRGSARKVALAGAAPFVLGALCCTQADERVTTVTRGEIRERFGGRAVVAPRDGTVELRAQVDARVQAVHVLEGERVRVGQLLVELSPEGIDSEVDRAQAEAESTRFAMEAVANRMRPQARRRLEAERHAARVSADVANRQLSRSRRLFQRGSLASALVDRDEASAAAAQARLHMAEAQLELGLEGATVADRHAAEQRLHASRAALRLARARLSWTRVVSPITGTVLARHVDPGDSSFAGPLGTPLLEIANLEGAELKLEVEETDAARLVSGLTVQLESTSDSRLRLTGQISRVSARMAPRSIAAAAGRERIDAQVRTAWIAVSWHDFSADPTLGMLFDASIYLPAKVAEALVPREAIRVNDGHATVDVQSASFGWREVDLILGADDGTFVSVRGIAAGAKVRLPVRKH
jgi:multidrug resistance efflux pump